MPEARRTLQGIAGRIVALHDMLDSLALPHQFGGAIALAWYRSPRATADIDVNVTLAPRHAEPLLGALAHLGVVVDDAERSALARDGQARLPWQGSYLDLFLATIDLHEEMSRKARVVSFGMAEIPILSPEHLVVCKAIFGRPKDWVDIEAMVQWGTDIDRREVRDWVAEILGARAPALERLDALLAE
ncbi:MAG: hypothetical protein ACYDA6_07580 [Solirubrobacteraceae bacterium]